VKNKLRCNAVINARMTGTKAGKLREKLWKNAIALCSAQKAQCNDFLSYKQIKLTASN